MMSKRFIDSIFKLPNDISDLHSFVFDIDDNFKYGYSSYMEESSLETLFASIIGIPLEFSLYYFNRSSFSDIERIISESYGVFLIIVNKEYSKLQVHIPSRIAMTKVFIVNTDNKSFKLLIPNTMHQKHIPEIQAIIIYLYTIISQQHLQVRNTWYKILQLFKRCENTHCFYEEVENFINDTKDINNDFQHYLQNTYKHINDLNFETNYNFLLQNTIPLSSIISENFVKLLKQCKYKQNSETVIVLEKLFITFTEDVLRIPSMNRDDDCKSYLINLKSRVAILCDNMVKAVKDTAQISIKITDDVFQCSVDDILHRTHKINHVLYNKFSPYLEKKRIMNLVDNNLRGKIHSLREILNSLENGKVFQVKLKFLIVEVIPLCIKSTIEISKDLTREIKDAYVVEEKELDLLIADRLQPLYDDIKTKSEYDLLVKLIELSRKLYPSNTLADYFKEETLNTFVCRIIDTLSGLSAWDIIKLCLRSNTSITSFLENLEEILPRLNSLLKCYTSYCTFFVPTSHGAKFIKDALSVQNLTLLQEYITNKKFFNATFVKIIPADINWTSYSIKLSPPFPIELTYNTIFINARDTVKHWEQCISNEISRRKIQEVAECLKDVCHENFKYIASVYTLIMLKNAQSELMQWDSLGIIGSEDSSRVSAKLNMYIQIVEELQLKLDNFSLQTFIMGCKCKEIQISGGQTTSFIDVMKTHTKNSIIEIDHSMLEYTHNANLEELLAASQNARGCLMEMRKENPFYQNKTQEILHKTLLNVLTNDPIMISNMSPLSNIDNFTFFIYIVENVIKLHQFQDIEFIIKDCLTKYRDSIICNQYDKINTVIVSNTNNQWTKLPWGDFSARKNIQEHLLRYLLFLDNISFRNKIERGNITLSCAELQTALFHFGKELCYIFYNEMSHNDMNILHNITPSNPSVLPTNNILTNIGYVLQSYADSIHVSLLTEYFNLLKNSKLIWAFLNVEEQPTVHNLIVLHKIKDTSLRVTECKQFTKYPVKPFTVSETLQYIKSDISPRSDESKHLSNTIIRFLYDESIYLQRNVSTDFPVVEYPCAELDTIESQVANTSLASFPIQTFECMPESMEIPVKKFSQYIPVKKINVSTQTIDQPMGSPDIIPNDIIESLPIENVYSYNAPKIDPEQFSSKDTVYRPKDGASENLSQSVPKLKTEHLTWKDTTIHKHKENVSGQIYGKAIDDSQSKQLSLKDAACKPKDNIDSKLNKTIMKNILVHIQTKTIASGTVSPHYYWCKDRLRKRWRSLQSKIAEIEEDISMLKIN